MAHGRITRIDVLILHFALLQLFLILLISLLLVLTPTIWLIRSIRKEFTIDLAKEKLNKHVTKFKSSPKLVGTFIVRKANDFDQSCVNHGSLNVFPVVLALMKHTVSF
jgi:hypothetical protein